MVNCQIMFIYVICGDMLYKWRLFPCDSKHQAPPPSYYNHFWLFTFWLSYCFAPKHLAKIRTTLLNDVNCLFKMGPIRILTCFRGSTDAMSTISIYVYIYRRPKSSSSVNRCLTRVQTLLMPFVEKRQDAKRRRVERLGQITAKHGETFLSDI